MVAETHPFMLEGMLAFLEPRFEIVATVTNGRTLVEQALLLNPDLIILNDMMPLRNGVNAAIQIKENLPAAKLLFFTIHANPAYLEAALSAGATGYVLKSAHGEELLVAIGRVLEGCIYVSPSLSNERMERLNDPRLVAAILRLTLRERESLGLIAQGKASKEIAYLLNISTKTVAFHRENIRRKLGLHSTAELTRHAVEQGLIPRVMRDFAS